MRLTEACEEYLLTCTANGLSPVTIKGYRTIISLMIRHVGDYRMETITPQMMLNYVVYLREAEIRYEDAPQKPKEYGSLSKSTIASYITTLKVFWAWASIRYSMVNPMGAIKKPKRPAPAPRGVDSGDYLKLFDGVACLRDKAILAVMADTGVRIGGLMDMTIERLNLARRRAWVTEKGGKPTTLFFSHFTAGLLGVVIGGRRGGPLWLNERTDAPLTRHGVYMMLKCLKQRTGVTGRVNPHAFRHGFARGYISSGGDISTLAKLLGHSDVSITARYYAVFDEDELQEFKDKFGRF